MLNLYLKTIMFQTKKWGTLNLYFSCSFSVVTGSKFLVYVMYKFFIV